MADFARIDRARLKGGDGLRRVGFVETAAVGSRRATPVRAASEHRARLPRVSRCSRGRGGTAARDGPQGNNRRSPACEAGGSARGLGSTFAVQTANGGVDGAARGSGRLTRLAWRSR